MSGRDRERVRESVARAFVSLLCSLSSLPLQYRYNTCMWRCRQHSPRIPLQSEGLRPTLRCDLGRILGPDSNKLIRNREVKERRGWGDVEMRVCVSLIFMPPLHTHHTHTYTHTHTHTHTHIQVALPEADREGNWFPRGCL